MRDDAGKLDRLWRVLKELRLYSIEGESLKVFTQTTLDDSLCSSKMGPELAISLRWAPEILWTTGQSQHAAKGSHSYFCSSIYSSAESNYSSHIKRRKLYSGSNIARLHYNQWTAWSPRHMLPHNIVLIQKDSWWHMISERPAKHRPQAHGKIIQGFITKPLFVFCQLLHIPFPFAKQFLLVLIMPNKNDLKFQTMEQKLSLYQIGM